MTIGLSGSYALGENTKPSPPLHVSHLPLSSRWLMQLHGHGIDELAAVEAPVAADDGGEALLAFASRARQDSSSRCQTAPHVLTYSWRCWRRIPRKTAAGAFVSTGGVLDEGAAMAARDDGDSPERPPRACAGGSARSRRGLVRQSVARRRIRHQSSDSFPTAPGDGWAGSRVRMAAECAMFT